jgi:glutaminyl-tRNA synthetase
VAKRDSVVALAQLEFSVREDLNRHSPRVMAVLRPMRVVIENYPDGQVEQLEAINNPENPADGTRRVPFSKVLYLERDDFREDPPRKWFRLAPGREVRLRYGYFITCREVIRNADGEVEELRCTYDPETRGGNAPDGRKVRGTLHWVSADHALPATARLYDRLFLKANPGGDEDLVASLNPDSLEVVKGCRVEPGLADATAGDRVQFERLGYYCVDEARGTDGELVFNRTVTLRDSWSRIEKSQTGRRG